MIPRLKPFLGKEEFFKAFTQISGVVEQFEKEFADHFNTRYAIAFSYGRSALWALLCTLELQDAEIILPAYTCSVVAHAIVLSNNIPRFVDISLDDFNMDLDQVKSAITSRTRAIIATHLFGYPLNVDRLNVIVKEAESFYGHKIWVIQDCAHSFGATFNDKPVINQPDVALFGLNISKQITSIFGGMLTTNDATLAQNIHNWRNSNFKSPAPSKAFRRLIYLFAIYVAFYEPFYSLVYWLQFRTPFLNHLTRAYHLDQEIIFPPGFDEFMLPIEARVGIAQLNKYEHIIQCRRETASFYHGNIKPHDGWIMPPLVEGATFSHYVIRVPDRKKVMEVAARQNLQLGELIEYCIPEWNQYKGYCNGEVFPNSSLCSRTTINLPIYASLSQKNKEKVLSIINSIE